MFKKIGFIGLGLIGGSLAKAIRKYHPDASILACDPNREALAQAVKEGVVNAVCREEDPSLAACDCLFLCAPVEVNLSYLRSFQKIIGRHTILTDVGSVKGPIHRAAKELGLDAAFIGGHPMAGSERTGYENAKERLLENAYYILTPEGNVSLEKLSGYTEFIASLGALPLVMTPREHDYITAGVSHIPHVIASSLVNLVQKLDDEGEHMKMIAAGGFRDITRIASSSPLMWEQICAENAENISQILDEYIRLLVQARCQLEGRDFDGIREMFSLARDYRDSMDASSFGPLKKAHMIYLDIADEAGGIATVATILAMSQISIKNIGIIHNREFEEGVLKIEFYDEQALSSAAALLKKRNYVLYER